MLLLWQVAWMAAVVVHLWRKHQRERNGEMGRLLVEKQWGNCSMVWELREKIMAKRE